MQRSNQYLSCVFGIVLGLAVTVGCGEEGNTVPVSGKVTVDGVPLVGVEVVFSPKSVGGNNNPGPYSFGETNENGEYSLKTRYKDEGAVIGPHKVIMQYPDMQPGVMDELRDALADAKDAEEKAAAQEEIAAYKKKLKGRIVIPKSATQDFDVPAGGNTSADFVLTSSE